MAEPRSDIHIQPEAGVKSSTYGINLEAMNAEAPRAMAAAAPVIADKFNAATPQRPEGNRLLDAPMVVMDLHALRQQIKREQAWHSSDRNAITVFKTAGLRVVLVALHAGAEMKTHTSAGTLTVQVLEGHLTFHTDPQAAELTKGQLLALHGTIPHSVQAREESVFLLTLAIATGS